MGTLVRGRKLNRHLRDLREATPSAGTGFLATQTTQGVMLHQHVFSVALEPPPDADPDLLALYATANAHDRYALSNGRGGRAVIPTDQNWQPDRLHIIGRRTANMLSQAARDSQLLVGEGGSFRCSSKDAITVDDGVSTSAVPTSSHRGAVATRYPSASGAALLRGTSTPRIAGGNNAFHKCGPTGTSIGLLSQQPVHVEVALSVTDMDGITSFIIGTIAEMDMILDAVLTPFDVYQLQIMVLTVRGDHFTIMPRVSGFGFITPAQVQINYSLTISFGEEDGGNIVEPSISVMTITPPSPNVLDPSTWTPILPMPFVFGPVPDRSLGMTFRIDAADWFRGL